MNGIKKLHRIEPGSTRMSRRSALFRTLSPMLGLGWASIVRSGPRPSARFNGFDLSTSIVPVQEIQSGGPPRDGIPAIDRPRFTTARQVNHLLPEDHVVSVTVGGRTRAYPLRILLHHEIVNDSLDGQAFVITYCPLCGTAMVFDRTVAGRRLDFGVSGLLYQSSLLMYDRQTQSLWSQIAMRAIAGPWVGRSLTWLESQRVTWAAWLQRNPTGEVLSPERGRRHTDYARNPYAGYEHQTRLAFPVSHTRRELPNKEWMVGVLAGGQPIAYPIAELAAVESVQHSLGDMILEVRLDPESRAVTVTDWAMNRRLPYVKLYWFAWQAFHPDTILWQP